MGLLLTRSGMKRLVCLKFICLHSFKVLPRTSFIFLEWLTERQKIDLGRHFLVIGVETSGTFENPRHRQICFELVRLEPRLLWRFGPKISFWGFGFEHLWEGLQGEKKVDLGPLLTRSGKETPCVS